MAPPCLALSLEEVVGKAQADGKPLFVLATSRGCPPCSKLKYRLENERELRELLRRYTSIHLDIHSADFRTWSRTYRPRRSAVPMIFIVSSKGEVIYNDSGAPSGRQLPDLLKRGLRRNDSRVQEDRPEPSGEQWRAVANAAELVDQAKYAGAIQVLAPYLSEPPAPSSPAAEHDDSLAAVTSRLVQMGRERLASGQRALEDERTRLHGMLAILKARRIFGTLPELKDPFEEACQRLHEDPRTSELVPQVEWIDRGRASEQSGDYAAAMETYRQVAETFPETLGARLCRLRVQQIVGQRVAAQPDAPQSSR
jgi:hypothetical protein